MTRRAVSAAILLVLVPVAGHASPRVEVVDDTGCVDADAIAFAVEEGLLAAASCLADTSAIETAIGEIAVEVAVVAPDKHTRRVAVHVLQAGREVWERGELIESVDCRTAPGFVGSTVRVGATPLLCPPPPLPPAPMRREIELAGALLAAPEGFPLGLALGLAANWRPGGGWVAHTGAETDVEGGLGLASDATAWRLGVELEGGLGIDVPVGGLMVRPSLGVAAGPSFTWGSRLVESRLGVLPRLEGEAGAALRFASGLSVGLGLEVPLLRYRYTISGGADTEPVLEPAARFSVGVGYSWEVLARERE